ncbi:MAG: TIR domain-containing protein [bacterium]
MSKLQQTEIPRIFISHAWEDKELVRRLEKTLADAGAEVWVDHADIRGGDNLPERINDALEWCNTLLLVWSKPAKASHWVKLEWTNAISLRKLIVPCPIDGTPAPPIMANTAYVDFSDEKNGVRELLQALRLAQIGETDSALANVIHSRLTQAEPAAVRKPPLQFRSERLDSLSGQAVKAMLKQHNFYCVEHDWSKEWCNPSGQGIKHQFELQQNGQVVVDHATGLFWQQAGSPQEITYADAEKYIRELNTKRFTGYNDWRLPTLEEVMSLMESKEHGELYLDPMFDRSQRWIWTADKESAGRAWCVAFDVGGCSRLGLGLYGYVRAVRSGQSVL